MRPSAARVRSHVNCKLSDWIKGDKVIVVLLYTCGWQILWRHNSRFWSTQVFERSFNVKLNTSEDTEEHPSVIHRPIKYPVELRHALSLPVSASTNFVTPTSWHIACLFSNWRKFKFILTNTDIFSFLSSEVEEKLFKTLIFLTNAKKWNIFTLIPIFLSL